MAKLRRNHQKSKGGATTAVRVAIFAAVLMGLLYFLWGSMGKNKLTEYAPHISDRISKQGGEKTMLPVSSSGEIIEHTHYALSYVEEYEQAEWVAYNLTKASIAVKNVERARWFNPDNAVKSGSAVHSDYRGSGYSRGHLAPAGDMAFSKEAMKESFFMSNMSPQVREFNQGIWNELEMSVRNWAWDNDQVYVVTGPVLSKGHILKYIGHNDVAVPDLFYKIVLDYTGKEKKGIGFLIPNKVSDKPLIEYAVSIDRVEEVTGIDFFSDAPISSIEKIESRFDTDAWRWDNKLYQQRINAWNKR